MAAVIAGLCKQLGHNLAWAVAKAGALLFVHALASCLLWRLLILGKLGKSQRQCGDSESHL